MTGYSIIILIRFRLNPWLTYDLGVGLRLSLDHTYERMAIRNARLYTAGISRLSGVYQFTVRTFFRAIVQYVDYDYDYNPNNYIEDIDSKDQRFFNQFLFPYKINARTVWFIGYADNCHGSQEYDLTRSNRMFFIKLGYARVR